MRKYMKDYRRKVKEKYLQHNATSDVDDFINKILSDSKVMNELKSEKLSEKLFCNDFEGFYVDDLINELIEEITEEV